MLPLRRYGIKIKNRFDSRQAVRSNSFMSIEAPAEINQGSKIKIK